MLTLLAAAVIFQHVVIVVQENRTPDNLFFELCTTRQCGDDGSTGYNIKTTNWLNKRSPASLTQPLPVALDNDYDLAHTHDAFVKMCDSTLGTCLMDGAARETCTGTCPAQPQFRYVDNSAGQIQPYLDLVTSYGWSNQMYATQQGPSFTAHQFIFGATSAPDPLSDAQGLFAAENYTQTYLPGCGTPQGSTVQLINANGNEVVGNTAYPCFERRTLSDLMDNHWISWRYYAPDAGFWTAPGAISHICQAQSIVCKGPLWTANVDLVSSDVLADITSCNLRALTWVVPTGANSDHPGTNDGGGPSWVASIVNAIGNSSCGYWPNTAIIIMWDDWGGWYDHAPPQVLPYPQGGYQLGFRVPLIFVSAYTPPMIDNTPSDFGSVARFIEQNFGFAEGALGFADSRATSDLTEFAVSSHFARSAFKEIKAPRKASWFLHDKRQQTPPDTD